MEFNIEIYIVNVRQFTGMRHEVHFFGSIIERVFRAIADRKIA